MLQSFFVALTLAPVFAPLPQDPPDARCRIHGRVVDDQGGPVAGARVIAHGWGGNQQRVAQHGVPAQWTDPEVRTGDDGHFDLRFVPPKAFQFTVQVEHDDYADFGWRWSQLAEGEERAQGDVTLVRPGVIEGHLATPGGDLLVDQWRIQASLATRLPHHAGISTKHCAIDPATGTYRFDDLPPGQVSLQAIRRTGERNTEVTVTTTAEAVTQAVLVYDGPDPARRIMLRIASSGLTSFATTQLAETAIRAVAADGTVHPFERVPNRGWEYWVKDLAPGEYRVEVDDPTLERWEQAGVRPGETISATLLGRARLRATVLGPDGAPVPRYRLTVQQTAPFRTSHVEELQSAGSSPPADGVYRGLLEGSYEVRVTADGYGEHRGVAEGVTGDATFELEVRLAPRRALRGRVVHDDGTPVAEGTVQLTLGEIAGHDMDPSAMMTEQVRDERGVRQVPVPYRDVSVPLDVNGGFDLGEVSAGPAVLRVLVGDWIRHDTRVDLAASSVPLVVTLPQSGSVACRVVFADERPAGELYLLPQRSLTGWLTARAPAGGRAGAVDSDGRCLLGPLLAGAQELMLVALGPDTGHGFSGMTPLARVRVEVAPGEPTPYDIDLAFTRPTTRVAVAVTLSGEPPSEALTFQLVPRDRYDAEGREQKNAYGNVVDGRAVLESVAAGDYSVEVSRTNLWTHESALPYTLTVEDVAAGEEASLAVDVPVVRGGLRVLAADGAPCADAEVWLGPATQNSMGVVLRTSAEATLELALASGRYAIHLGAPDRLSMVDRRKSTFEWTLAERPQWVRLPAR
jgi:hypothetical protein